jgi:hypothetical protein
MAMSGAKKLRILSGTLTVLFLLNSCADFFSTSWGEMFKRNPKNVKVTASNVYDLLDAAKSDPELSRAILEKINADSGDTLKHAAIKAANQAAGVTTLLLENIATLIDASKSNSYEDAITKVTETIRGAVKDNDVVGSDKLTEILGTEMTIFEDPRSALINAKGITVTVPQVNAGGGSGGEAMVSISEVGEDGKGKVIITVNGVSTNYACVINDKDGNGNQTITLTGAGENGRDVVLSYVIDAKTHALTLSGLDEIANKGLASVSNPSRDSLPVKPEFAEGFLDDSVPDSDLVLMVVALILAKFEKVHEANPMGYPSLEVYLKSWEQKNVTTGYNMDADEILIAAIVNGMISRGELSGRENELIQMLKDLLKVGE